MKIKITAYVKPNSKHESLDVISAKEVRVKVNAAPIDGKANAAVQKLLAKHFKVAKSKVTLLHGDKSKTKVFEIET